VPPGSLALVHAHPDDESLFTAGATRKYADEGRRVVLITCTDGRLGLDARARAGNDPRHDAATVVATRAGELAHAAELLGVARHVRLGYRDSGLGDWATAQDPECFARADLDAVARTVATILDDERCEVVVTYDEYGYYGHPDHVAAHRATRRAVEMSSAVERLYYPVTPRDRLGEFVERAAALGLALPLWVLDAGVGCEPSEVAATLDVTALVEVKRAAIAAHASQVDNADLVTMDEDLFRLLFGHEHYRLGWSRSGKSGAANDLFGGAT
jgi:LmbE family N-acetylglucosaminyl deacetylase